MTPTHRGGARGGELSRLRDAPDWRLGPAHPGSHRVAGGSGASHRACLHRQDLPSVSAAPSAHRATGRRSAGAPASGRQPDQPHRHATGRRAPADPQHPVVSAHRPSAEPQRGGHRERHSPDRATGPTSGGLGWWTASAPAQWSTPTKPAGVRMGTMATCGLSAPPPSATSCGGVGARRWWTKRWASRSPECWSAISTLPTHHYDGPQATVLGPPVAGHPRPGGALPQGHLAGPVGRGSPSALCRGQVFHPSSGTTTAHRSTDLGAAAAGHLPALPG